MNDTSSRSHCVAVLKLTVLEGGAVRTSRLQFFDLMGSERFVGQNAAHDTGHSSKSTQSGWEGPVQPFALSSLFPCTRIAACYASRAATGPHIVPGLLELLSQRWS